MATLEYQPYRSIVITGGGGMLARAFARTFRARGLQCSLVTRQEWDVTDIPQVELLFEDYGPTLVVNCAAYTKVDQAEQEIDRADAVNRLGPANVATICAEQRAPLVHFSTDFVFDGAARSPYRTDHPTSPLCVYGQTKLAGEHEIQKVSGLTYLIIRTAWLYGPGGPNFVQTMLNLAKAGKPIRVVDDQIGAPTFTHDLAEATLKLIDRGATGIWHVTNAGQTTWFGFAQAIFEEFNLKADLQPISSAEWKKLKPNSATRPAYSVLDIEPYAQLTGTPMRHWREALRDYHRVVQSDESRA